MNFNDEFEIVGFDIYDQPLIINEKVFLIPELWRRVEDDDICYHERISPYCVNYFSIENNPNQMMCVTDLNFFNAVEFCNKLTIFTSKPIKVDTGISLDFSKMELYDDVVKRLTFVGWNVVNSVEGSAFTDGLYPAYLDQEIQGNLCYSSDLDVSLNQFGLLDNLEDSLALCEINSKHPRNEEFWYPSGLYVDSYTYSIISSYT